MIRTDFGYARPGTLDEAVQLLASADGRGSVLGGGSVLVPAMSSGEEHPSLVLDASCLGLRCIRHEPDCLVIGAGVTYAELEASDLVTARLPLLAAMVREVTGGPGLWNLATLGGSACRANPASDGPGCLAALQAQFRLCSVRGTRDVPSAQFFRGAHATDRAPDEILTEIILPVRAGQLRTAYLKLKHSASSWPIVTSACISDEAGSIRLCLGGVSPIPVVLEWPPEGAISEARVGSMARQAVAAIKTEWTDELAGPGYRLAVAGTMAARAIHAVSDHLA